MLFLFLPQAVQPLRPANPQQNLLPVPKPNFSNTSRTSASRVPLGRNDGVSAQITSHNPSLASQIGPMASLAVAVATSAEIILFPSQFFNSESWGSMLCLNSSAVTSTSQDAFWLCPWWAWHLRVFIKCDIINKWVKRKTQYKKNNLRYDANYDFTEHLRKMRPSNISLAMDRVIHLGQGSKLLLRALSSAEVRTCLQNMELMERLAPIAVMSLRLGPQPFTPNN